MKTLTKTDLAYCKGTIKSNIGYVRTIDYVSKKFFVVELRDLSIKRGENNMWIFPIGDCFSEFRNMKRDIYWNI
jgi:hypothetical protein